MSGNQSSVSAFFLIQLDERRERGFLLISPNLGQGTSKTPAYPLDRRQQFLVVCTDLPCLGTVEYKKRGGGRHREREKGRRREKGK